MSYWLFSVLRATDFGVSLEDALFEKPQLAPTDSAWHVHLMTLRYAFSLKNMQPSSCLLVLCYFEHEILGTQTIGLCFCAEVMTITRMFYYTANTAEQNTNIPVAWVH